ncbi:PleD family two-component system response regulator [Mucilaginibacter calamicampi]|uniref:PleD family two-component system response regulator n=1 Tax=Mucilaginibacter calamicampi TaxID=1302352 RepID=A0ABW2YSX8_9SPHI
MIIDDEAEILELLRHVLQEAGYEVMTGRDVTDLYEIEKDPPDLLLVDNWLEGKTGHDICYHLKTTPKTSDIPVLLISATPNLARTAESCLADDFIAKPFEITELLEKIKSNLS